jgi:hypothetical protein
MDSNGTLYVADDGNQRVLKYPSGSLNGILVAGINGSAGSSLSQLNGPISIVVDNNGYVKTHLLNCREPRVVFITKMKVEVLLRMKEKFNLVYSKVYYFFYRYIYVADAGNNRIVKWTTNYSAGGVCITGCTGTAGNAPNQLNGPRDLKFDRYGNLYVTDQGNHRILKYAIILPTSACPSSKYFENTRGVTYPGNWGCRRSAERCGIEGNIFLYSTHLRQLYKISHHISPGCVRSATSPQEMRYLPHPVSRSKVFFLFLA